MGTADGWESWGYVERGRKIRAHTMCLLVPQAGQAGMVCSHSPLIYTLHLQGLGGQCLHTRPDRVVLAS